MNKHKLILLQKLNKDPNTVNRKNENIDAGKDLLELPISYIYSNWISFWALNLIEHLNLPGVKCCMQMACDELLCTIKVKVYNFFYLILFP